MNVSSTAVRSAWALRLPADAAATLMPLRLRHGVEVGEHAGELWLRGQSADDDLAAILLTLPATVRYAWHADGRLQPLGAVLAVEQLPATEWQPLQRWLRFALPVARLPADPPPRIQLALKPAHGMRTANAALVSLVDFLDWMRDAPALRLSRLRFAATASGQCLVLGTPLPAVQLRPCCETSGVVIPAGLAWTPVVSAKVVRQLLQAPDDAIVWWDETGAHVLSAELFVRASRSAARATRLALANGGNA